MTVHKGCVCVGVCPPGAAAGTAPTEPHEKLSLRLCPCGGGAGAALTPRGFGAEGPRGHAARGTVSWMLGGGVILVDSGGTALFLPRGPLGGGAWGFPRLAAPAAHSSDCGDAAVVCRGPSRARTAAHSPRHTSWALSQVLTEGPLLSALPWCRLRGRQTRAPGEADGAQSTGWSHPVPQTQPPWHGHPGPESSLRTERSVRHDRPRGSRNALLQGGDTCHFSSAGGKTAFCGDLLASGGPGPSLSALGGGCL